MITIYKASKYSQIDDSYITQWFTTEKAAKEFAGGSNDLISPQVIWESVEELENSRLKLKLNSNFTEKEKEKLKKLL